MDGNCRPFFVILVGMILAVLALAQSSFRVGCPMKENEEWFFKTVEILKTDGLYHRDEKRCIQRVLDIDDHGVQHVEIECLGGICEVTLLGEKQDPDDLKGDSKGLFLNGNGQEFEYEEVKATYEENPLLYLNELIHTPLTKASVGIGESWRRKTALTDVIYKVLPVKKLDKLDCFGIERTGTFISPFSGTFKMTQWFRCDNGRMQRETTSADDISGNRLPVIDYTFTYEATEK